MSCRIHVTSLWTTYVESFQLNQVMFPYNGLSPIHKEMRESTSSGEKFNLFSLKGLSSYFRQTNNKSSPTAPFSRNGIRSIFQNSFISKFIYSFEFLRSVGERFCSVLKMILNSKEWTMSRLLNQQSIHLKIQMNFEKKMVFGKAISDLSRKKIQLGNFRWECQKID
jgi:hypothetical protein